MPAACYQAAVAALLHADIRPRDPTGKWGHDFVRASFDGILIGRRNLYPSSARGTLAGIRVLRELADYKPESVKQRDVDRAVRQTREFVRTIRPVGGTHQ